MLPDSNSPVLRPHHDCDCDCDCDCDDSPVSSTCYFSYVPTSTHDYYSPETPHTRLSAYSDDISPDPVNPLLAQRPRPRSLHLLPPPSAATMDASRLLQLQTQAAHAPRPSPLPLQKNGVAPSTLSAGSSDSTSSESTTSSTSTCPTPPQLCCTRCRRTSIGVNGMIQFGTNLYYCSHCASMTGYTPAG